jgi:hypothetical protein
LRSSRTTVSKPPNNLLLFWISGLEKRKKAFSDNFIGKGFRKGFFFGKDFFSEKSIRKKFLFRSDKSANSDYKVFLNFLTGAGTEEGPETAYKREEELEQARKGVEDVFDPEGILDEEDEEMEMSSEDKETQTGNLLHDGKDIATQANLRRLCKTVGSQTGRSLQRMSMEDPALIRSGQYVPYNKGW